jgi:alkanesulfonate monooxygenase SsuD/methylene tetrahydromethanopterin reductase-like flavin-dependent oxidoreductase (luciferase family)
MGFVGDTDAEAKDNFFPGWAHLTGTIGRERGWSTPTRQQFEAMASPEGAFLIGEPATVAAKMLEASEALGGISRFTFQMSTASLETAAMKRSIELLGTPSRIFQHRDWLEWIGRRLRESRMMVAIALTHV